MRGWQYGIILLMLAVVTFCVAIMIQLVVATEFESYKPHKESFILLKTDEPTFKVWSQNWVLDFAPPKELYVTPNHPMRLEPDKACAFIMEGPKLRIIEHFSGYEWRSGSYRKTRHPRSKKENSDEGSKCPLIPKP